MKPNIQVDKIEWVFFDLDGTLADSVSSLFNVYKNFLEELNIVAHESDLSLLNGVSLAEIVSFIKEKYKINRTDKDLIKLYKSNLSYVYEHEVKPLDDAGKVLQRLRESFKLQLVTSGGSDHAMAFIRKQGWNEFFNSYVFGDEVRKGKPDPEIYNLAIRKTNSSIKNIVTVEDSLNGVTASVAAGLPTIAIAHKNVEENLLDAGALKVIQKLGDLIPAFLQIQHDE